MIFICFLLPYLPKKGFLYSKGELEKLKMNGWLAPNQKPQEKKGCINEISIERRVYFKWLLPMYSIGSVAHKS